MWPFFTVYKRKKFPLETKVEPKIEIKMEEKPKAEIPKKMVAMSIELMRNDRSGYEYTIKSINEFGLSWSRPYDNYFYIGQYFSEDQTNYRTVAAVINFSIKRINFQEYSPKPKEAPQDKKEDPTDINNNFPI